MFFILSFLPVPILLTYNVVMRIFPAHSSENEPLRKRKVKLHYDIRQLESDLLSLIRGPRGQKYFHVSGDIYIPSIYL